MKTQRLLSITLCLSAAIWNGSARAAETTPPDISPSAYAVVQQAVTVTPQQLTLPPGPLKSPLTLAVRVRNNSTNDLTIFDVRLDIPGVEVKTTEPQRGHVFSIRIAFPAGLELKPDQRHELTFRSSHSNYLVVRVPVIQAKPVTPTTTLKTLETAAATNRLQTPSPTNSLRPIPAPPTGLRVVHGTP